MAGIGAGPAPMSMMEKEKRSLLREARSTDAKPSAAKVDFTALLDREIAAAQQLCKEGGAAALPRALEALLAVEKQTRLVCFLFPHVYLSSSQSHSLTSPGW